MGELEDLVRELEQKLINIETGHAVIRVGLYSFWYQWDHIRFKHIFGMNERYMGQLWWTVNEKHIKFICKNADKILKAFEDEKRKQIEKENRRRAKYKSESNKSHKRKKEFINKNMCKIKQCLGD